MLGKSELNHFGFFDADKTKENAQTLMQAARALSPYAAKQWELECQYGGLPASGQMVREGHLPKYSAFIDEAEKVAIKHMQMKDYMNVLK